MVLRKIAIGLTLLLAACGTTPESKNIRLDLVGALPPVTSALNGTLQVMPFGARGILGERRLVYADVPGERKQSASYMWEEYPSQAAAIVTVEALRSTGVAQAVFGPERPGLADYALSARLDRFELAQNSAVVDLDVTILQGAERKAFLAGNYCASVVVNGNDTPAVATAFDEAFRQVLVQLTGDIARGRTTGTTRAPC